MRAQASVSRTAAPERRGPYERVPSLALHRPEAEKQGQPSQAPGPPCREETNKKDAGLLAGSDRTDAHFAATAGRSDLLEEAMEQNIDLSHADKDGMTASRLHCACARARGAACGCCWAC